MYENIYINIRHGLRVHASGDSSCVRFGSSCMPPNDPHSVLLPSDALLLRGRVASVDKHRAVECRSQAESARVVCVCMRQSVCLRERCACGKEYSTLCRMDFDSVSSYVHSVPQHKKSFVRVPLRSPYCLYCYWQVYSADVFAVI